MEDYDCFDNEFGEIDAYNEGKRGLIVIGIIMVVFVAFVLWSEFDAMSRSNTMNMEDVSPADIIETEDLPIIYDSEDNIHIEHEEPCPECGKPSIAVDDEIVCRNEDCPNYGLAVSIEWDGEY